MIAPLAKFIDWSALQMACAVGLDSVPKSQWKLQEALAFLNGPDFIPAASDPAQIQFAGPPHFKFPTPLPGEVDRNNIVYGRLYKCAELWRERPVIILLHGSPALGYHTAFPLLARRFNRAGFNVATLVAAYHLQRHPRGPIQYNCLKFAQAIAQNIAEIRALTGWLLDQGCHSVALLGVSFGAWLAGLTACADARITSVVLALPAVRMRPTSPVIWPRVREELHALRPAHEAMDTTRLNLLTSMPVIPKESILFIQGIYDLFADSQAIEELWKKWRQPEIWRLPQGHISALFVPGLPSRILRWLAPRMQAPRKNPT